jgi:hypothetical protein
LCFSGRDIGFDDDKECMDTLLFHLVAFYTRDSNSFSGDSNEDLSNFLR